MPDHVTLDVLTRPRSGVRGTARLATAQRGGPLRAVIPLRTGPFPRTAVPRLPTPRRLALLCGWDDTADPLAAWRRLVAPLVDRSHEHWHLRAEVVRAHFSEPWHGWSPDVAGSRPLADDEPTLILISGDLKPRHAMTFVRDGARATVQLDEQSGYLGGFAMLGCPTNLISCSAWRSYAEAKAYAYRPGAHRDAMRRDLAGEHHRTQWFLRLRPITETGTLDGRALFAGHLGSPAATPGS